MQSKKALTSLKTSRRIIHRPEESEESVDKLDDDTEESDQDGIAVEAGDKKTAGKAASARKRLVASDSDDDIGPSQPTRAASTVAKGSSGGGAASVDGDIAEEDDDASSFIVSDEDAVDFGGAVACLCGVTNADTYEGTWTVCANELCEKRMHAVCVAGSRKALCASCRPAVKVSRPTRRLSSSGDDDDAADASQRSSGACGKPKLAPLSSREQLHRRLFDAADAGKLDAARAALEAGASAGWVCVAQRASTSVHRAAVRGDAAMLGVLVPTLQRAVGADLDNARPMQLAIAAGSLECVRLLLPLEQLDEARNGDEDTCVHMCCAHNRPTLLQAVLEAMPWAAHARNAAGQTPAACAAVRGAVECLQHMIAFDPKAARMRSLDEATLLHLAASSGEHEIFSNTLLFPCSTATL